MLPELQHRNQQGKIDKITLICLALLWCKDTDYQMGTKDAVFKELTRKNSIKFMVEKLIRISTVLVYGRLKDFGINCNTFLIDHEFDVLNAKIKTLVEEIYKRLQIDEEEMEQDELEKKIRVPRYLYEPQELRKKLN